MSLIWHCTRPRSVAYSGTASTTTRPVGSIPLQGTVVVARTSVRNWPYISQCAKSACSFAFRERVGVSAFMIRSIGTGVTNFCRNSPAVVVPQASLRRQAKKSPLGTRRLSFTARSILVNVLASPEKTRPHHPRNPSSVHQWRQPR